MNGNRRGRVIVPRAVSRIVNVVLAVAVIHGGTAWAAESTREMSAGGGGRRTVELFDVDVSLGWTHDGKRAAIRREAEGESTGGRIAVARELVHRQVRDVLQLGVDAGVYRDVKVFVRAPLVLGDARSLDFDGACAGSSAGGCVDENSATILRDGLLPGYKMPSFGIDAEHGRPFQRPSETVFDGPARHGLESLGFGVSWMVLNQARDPVRPTWIVAFQSRFAVGAEMAFDPQKPTDNRGVALGYHQLLLSTVFSRQFRAVEPFVGGWYMVPIATPDSAWQRPGLGRGAFSRPQQRGGTDFGLTAVAWEDARAHHQIGFELRGRLELRMFGLARAELWEPLSGMGAGVVRSPAYGLFGGDAGINVQVGRLIRFRGLFGLTFEEAHFLTDARSGNSLIDIPGRRFRVEDSRTWQVVVDGGLVF